MINQSTLNDMRVNGLVCDGIVRTKDGGRFPVHRVILCVLSPYFKAYFTNSLQNGEPELNHLYLEDCSAEMTSWIIEFAYTQTCGVRPEQLEQLLIIADRLSCDTLVSFCSDLLTKNLSPANCVSTLRFARSFFVWRLESAAWRYLCEHMEKVSLTTLAAYELSALLSSDELVVSCEEAVYEAAAEWVRADPDVRACHTAALLHCVRFGRVNGQYFADTVMTFEHHTKESRDLVETLQLLFEDDDNGYFYRNCYYRPRMPNEIVFVLGGWSDGCPTNTIETYDKESDSWLLAGHPCATTRAYHGAATVDGRIYVFGGFDGVEYYNTTYCFDPADLSWTEKGCMHTVRCYVSSCIVDGEIYAIGGYTGRHRLNSAEKYNPEKNQWTEIHPMHRIRSDACATAMAGKVYIAGGFDGDEVLSSVEVYDPKENQWTFLEPMTSPRSGLSMITLGSALYVFGGFDGDQRLVICEMYSLATREWQRIASMPTPRSNMSSIILDNKICLIGGFNGLTTISSTHLYDPETNTWVKTGRMNFSRSAMSASVVRGLPNARSFSTLGTSCYNCGDGQWTKVSVV